MTVDDIKKIVVDVIVNYPIKSIVLFGSRADGTNGEDSDVDLIVVFNKPVSLLVVSKLKIDLQDALHLPVDLIHGPIRDGDMIEVGKEILLYAA